MHFLSAAIILLFLPWIALGKTVQMATFPIPLFVVNSEKGGFVELTKEIARRNNLDVKIHILPNARVLLKFSAQEVQGFFPAHDQSLVKSSVKTVPFYVKTDFIFHKKGLALSDIRSLEGKKVGLTFRFSYLNELLANKNIRFEYGQDEVLNMRKLGEGLIDAFIAEELSGLKALKDSGAKDIVFDKTKPIFSQEIYYAFHDDAEGRSLAALFSKTITAMKIDGSIKKYLKAP